MVLVIGENIKVRRFAIFTEGVSVPYIHAGGKIGVLVNLKVEGDIDATAVGKDVAMQIAALNPRFWDKSQVSQDVLDEEKKIMMVQMENDPKMASKPEQVTREDRHGQDEQVLLRELPAAAGVRPRRCVHRHRGAVYR